MRDLKAEGKRMIELNTELIEYLKEKHPEDKVAKIMISGLRDDIFQNWHKVNLNPKECYCTDMDFIEVRNGRGLVALIEGKREDHSLKENGMQIRLFPEMAKKLGVPFFFIQYSDDLTRFTIFKVKSASDKWSKTNCEKLWFKWIETIDGDEYVELNKKEFIKFMEKL